MEQLKPKVMKRLICFILLLAAGSLAAQNIELSNELISEYNKRKARSALKSASLHDHLWLTPLLNKVFLNWDDLNENAKELFSQYQVRPSFSVTADTYIDGNFMFHYVTGSTVVGENVSDVDENKNGIPDYVEYVASVFNTVYDKFHVELGYALPPPDKTDGGNSKYDVYLNGESTGDGVYGYVRAYEFVGDNINSPDVQEYQSAVSFMVMRNNYEGFGTSIESAIKATVAHEYMHSIQNGYSATMDPWFMEIASAWAEEFVFPGTDDNLQYLPMFYEYPDVSLTFMDGEGGLGQYDGHWYSVWLFLKYATEQTSNNILKDIYIECIKYYAVDAINRALAVRATSLYDLFEDFIVTNSFMINGKLYHEDSYKPYVFERGDVYSSFMNKYNYSFAENSTVMNYTGADLFWDSSVDGNGQLMRMSADYFKFSSSSDFKIKLTSEDDADVLLMVVKRKGSNIEVIKSETGEIDINDHSSWDEFIPIVLRFDKSVINVSSYNYNLNFTKSATTSVEMEKEASIQIYPNPANDIVYVEENQIEIEYAELVDVSGKVVFLPKVIGNSLQIGAVVPGVYFLNLYDGDGLANTSKIVIAQ